MNRIHRTISMYRRLVRKLARNEWFIRLLNLPRCVGTGAEPGLVMIQIDGLAQSQFQRALSRGRLPFIRKLIANRGFTEKSFYAGLPSATPGVQAELFYGVKTAVPAFEFIDRKSGKRQAMFYPTCVNEVARRLQKEGEPLLKGGSSYSNIYSGGALNARYCAETMGLQSLVKAVNPFRLIFILLFHLGKMLRVMVYAGIELILAGYDFFRGIFDGKHLFSELKFIPTRLFVCAILRELIRFRVKMDVTRGIPIISANFFGYDEQAHRRGPGSAFAHWTLKGIDGVIEDIYEAAIHSECRDYRVVIYSDHGQESVLDYQNHAGKPLKQAVRELYHKTRHTRFSPHASITDNTLDYLYRRTANLLFGNRVSADRHRKELSSTCPDDIEITTMGPLGHVYLPDTTRDGCDATGRDFDLGEFARILNRQADIPLVLFRKNKTVFAANASGTYELVKNPAIILGEDHPFLEQAAADLKDLCLHPNAGDLVISGWRPGRIPLSFNIENGSHGGPGKEETRGFVILPPNMKNDSAFLRPLDLRNQIFAYLGKVKSNSAKPAVKPPVHSIADKHHHTHHHLKIMTYNIHSCIHMDGRVNPDRTADVIAALDPDIAALQEVDAGRKRTQFIYQGHYLAEHLGLACRFFPVLANGDERYGLAILSRFPFVSLKCGHLPHESNGQPAESRGAMMAALETPMGLIRLVNTHLGLRSKERRRQVATILGNDWAAQPLKHDVPLIICGDFNAGANSFVYKSMSKHVSDVQVLSSHKKYPQATFSSRYPVLRLDHIFVSRHFRPGRVMVPNDYEARMVSDHLPVYCELFPVGR